MNWANRIAFVLICATIIFTTVAYGTVHQPVLALFYVVIAAIMVLWAIDGLKSGTIRFSRSLIQVPLLAAAVYGVIQAIPFGQIAETAGVSDGGNGVKVPGRFIAESARFLLFSPVRL